jgi:hypothetical protein
MAEERSEIEISVRAGPSCCAAFMCGVRYPQAFHDGELPVNVDVQQAHHMPPGYDVSLGFAQRAVELTVDLPFQITANNVGHPHKQQCPYQEGGYAYTFLVRLAALQLGCVHHVHQAQRSLRSQAAEQLGLAPVPAEERQNACVVIFVKRCDGG